MSLYTVRRKLTILQVEDSESDAALVAYAFRRIANQHAIHLVKDGLEALRFLRRGEAYADVPRPDLILLDIGLPGLDGLEVLREIKLDQTLKDIPVIMFSSSETSAVLRDAYSLQANSYVVKPPGFEAYMQAIESIESYWANVAALPEIHA